MGFSLDIESLPTLPVIAAQVMECLNDPNSSIQDVADVILRDQSMSVKILKLVNSAFYGFPKRIGTLSHAISILGFETVRGLVLGISILDTFRVKEFDLLHFWEHSIRTASLMSFLADRLCYPRRDEAFTVGLIHDVGKLVFMLKAPDLYRQVVQQAETNPCLLEQQLMKMDHAFAGAQVARSWNFPATYVHAIETHHQRPGLPLDLPSLKEMVYLASMLDHYYDGQQLPEEDLQILSQLDLALEPLEDYLHSIRQEVQDFLRILAPAP
ncbi:MAG TPA: HDOD domain-containing protein [Candidatus Obscuribacterales bacterium]